MGRSLNTNSPKGATPIDPDELQGLKFDHVKTRSQLDQLEHVNIQEGLNWVISQNQDILNIKFCLKLHKRLFGKVWEWAGEFRKSEKNIGIDPIQISFNLQNLFDDTRAWVELNSYEPLEAALRFHHRLVYIHPFSNGNGRHARIMADALLRVHFKTHEINWFEKNLASASVRRQAYINSLREADKHNYGPLLSMFKLYKES